MRQVKKKKKRAVGVLVIHWLRVVDLYECRQISLCIHF